MLRVQKDRK